MVGTRIGRQIQTTAQGTPLRITGAVDHPPHACLHQGTGAHRTGLQGDQKGAGIETPVPEALGRLPQGHQLGMAEGILIALAPVTPPAKASPAPIQHHGRHRHLAALSGTLRLPKQPPHPSFLKGPLRVVGVQIRENLSS